MEIEHGYWRWKIYRWDRHPNPFRGRSDLALNWLRRFETDRRTMSELRQLLDDARSGAMARATDRQVLEDVALRISTGEFQVCAESSHPFQQDITEVKVPGASSTEEIESVTPAPAPKPAPAAPPPAPVTEDTLPANADVERVAESLKAAAKTGTPFCEECQKAAAAKPTFTLPMPAGSAASQRSTETQSVMRTSSSSSGTAADAAVPTSEGGISPNLDPVAFSNGMRQASAAGSPFCAETERASP